MHNILPDARFLRTHGRARSEASDQPECQSDMLLVPFRVKIIAIIMDTVADLYSSLKKKGRIISDADIFISATALVNNYDVVTNNHKHFSRINDLLIRNWLE